MIKPVCPPPEKNKKFVGLSPHGAHGDLAGAFHQVGNILNIKMIIAPATISASSHTRVNVEYNL